MAIKPPLLEPDPCLDLSAIDISSDHLSLATGHPAAHPLSSACGFCSWSEWHLLVFSFARVMAGLAGRVNRCWAGSGHRALSPLPSHFWAMSLTSCLAASPQPMGTQSPCPLPPCQGSSLLTSELSGHLLWKAAPDLLALAVLSSFCSCHFKATEDLRVTTSLTQDQNFRFNLRPKS